MSDRNDHFYRLMMELQEFHSIFYQIVEFGCKPIFTDDPKRIDTACIHFDDIEDQSKLSFLFNINFWNVLNNIERKFIICHEMLHILLDHVPRFIQAHRTGRDAAAINIAADIAINETLIDFFDFDREDMPIVSRQLCFIDNVFEERAAEILPDQNAEYYFNLLEKKTIKIGVKLLLNNHSNFSKSVSDLVERLGEKMSKYDKQKLEKMLMRHFGMRAGVNPGDIRHTACSWEKKKKVRWDKVIKTWHEVQKRRLFETTNWASSDRRYEDIINKGGFILPGTREMIHEKKNRISLFMFLDTSQSCSHLADRFFNVALTIDQQYFDLHLVCFDTKAYATSLKSKQLYGFGGTDFKCITKYVREHANSRYAVFVITDGEGTDPQIEESQRRRYHWFLTQNYTRHIPDECFVYDLRKFE